jgi:hypothetical protein
VGELFRTIVAWLEAKLLGATLAQQAADELARRRREQRRFLIEVELPISAIRRTYVAGEGRVTDSGMLMLATSMDGGMGNALTVFAPGQWATMRVREASDDGGQTWRVVATEPREA